MNRGKVSASLILFKAVELLLHVDFSPNNSEDDPVPHRWWSDPCAYFL